MRSLSTTCPRPWRRRPAPAAAWRRAGGFTLLSLTFLLVVLTALGAALANIAVRQQLGSAAEVDAARALQAAKAGLEWAAWQVLRNPAPPAAAPACFGNTSFSPPGLDSFTVTVSCTRTPSAGTVNDGSAALVFYQLVANACNAPAAGACPNSATPSRTYAERQLSWTVLR
jgi:MSHA biogenesis protein MshP